MMRAMKTISAALILTFAAASAAGAAPPEFQFGLAFNPSLPQGGFHDVLGRTIWGGSFQFAFRPSGSPVLLGTSLGFGIYGSDSWQDWLGVLDPDVLVDIRTTNAVLAWSVFLRLQPSRGLVRPYIDLFAGLHLLTTDTRIGDGDRDDDGSGGFSVNNASDTAFAIGAGAGVMLPVVRFVHRDGRLAASINLDLGVRYAAGGRADYLVKTDRHGVFDERTSRTDLLTLNAGLSCCF